MQAGKTSVVGSFTILSLEEFHNKYADHTLHWSIVSAITLLATAAPYFYSHQLATGAAKAK